MIERTTGLARIPALLLVLLLAGSCADGPQHFWMVFDPCDPIVLEPEGATAEQRAAMERAVQMWRDVAAVQVGFDGPPDARRLRIEMVQTEWYMGRFDDQEGEIEIADRVTDLDVFTIVLAHELGHAFGLYHVEADDRVSVMNEGNKTIAPNEGDVEVLEHMWGSCIRGQTQLPPSETVRY